MATPTDSGFQTPTDIDLELQKTHNEELPPLPDALDLVQSRVEPPKSLPQEIAFVAIICMAQFMTQAGLATAIVPLHIIGDSFGVKDPGQLSWYAAAYSLTVGTFILIAGRLGDLYGHKKFFVAGFAWFALWSLVAGFSVYTNSIFFDVCRAMQGIGPAFLMPNALAILGRTYDQGPRKDMVFSLFGATAPGGFVGGAIISSLFSQLLWWPWAYWVFGIVCAVLALIGIFAIPSTPPPEFGDKSVSMLSRIDVAGSLTGFVGLILINFAWNQGPVVGWSTPYTYVLLIVGFIFIGAFAFIESRASYPLLPMDVLTVDTGFVMACMAAGWSSFGVWVFYLWQVIEELKGASPLLGTAYFVPTAISGFCAALLTGFILSKVPPSVTMIISMSAFTIGGIIAATAPVEQIYWAQIFVSVCVMPWGMDMSFPSATILLSNTMRREHQGIAASLINTVVNYSISIGLGIAGTVESQVNSGGADVLKGYRGAQYVGIGLSSLGVVTAMLFGLTHMRRAK